jgi:hypothetical protein
LSSKKFTKFVNLYIHLLVRHAPLVRDGLWQRIHLPALEDRGDDLTPVSIVGLEFLTFLTLLALLTFIF